MCRAPCRSGSSYVAARTKMGHLYRRVCHDLYDLYGLCDLYCLHHDLGTPVVCYHGF